MKVGCASGVYWAHHLDAHEAPDRTIACGVPDFKERFCIAHGGCRKRQFLGMLEPGLQAPSVVQQEAIVVSLDLQGGGVQSAGYAGYIKSIHD